MGKIGDITTLALVVGGGYLLLTNWQGIKDFFGSFTGLLGGEPGTGPGLSSSIFHETEVPLLDAPLEEGGQLTGEVGTIPSFLDLALLGSIPPSPQYIPLPTPEDEPPSFWDLLNPFKGVDSGQPEPLGVAEIVDMPTTTKRISRTLSDPIYQIEPTPEEPAGYDDIRPFDAWFSKVQ